MDYNFLEHATVAHTLIKKKINRVSNTLVKQIFMKFFYRNYTFNILKSIKFIITITFIFYFLFLFNILISTSNTLFNITKK
jgi:hypothetical protein